VTVDTKVIERVISIDAPPETVFRLLTDPTQYVRWKGKLARLPPRRVVFTRGWEGNEMVPPGSSMVEIELEREGRGTRLRLGSPGLARGGDHGPHMDTNNPMGYAMIDTHAGKGIGAGIGTSRDGKNMVTFYVESDNLKGTLAKAEKLGARTIQPPTQTGPVEIALFADPRATSSASRRGCDPKERALMGAPRAGAGAPARVTATKKDKSTRAPRPVRRLS
jgi:hypothetical protein